MLEARLIPTRRPSPSAFCRTRWVAFLCALAVLLGAGGAFAAAPMCGEHAESIAAPLPFGPAKTGEIRAVPGCDDSLGSELKASPVQNGPLQLASAEVVERALLPSGVLPTCPRGALVLRPSVVSDATQPAFYADIFRPPRSLSASRR
jgi:hypothetical protein